MAVLAQSPPWILGLEPVCASWSAARRAPAWSRLPHRLRQAGRHIYGLPQLTSREQQLVLDGNRMRRHAVAMVLHHMKQGGRGYLENPMSSLWWRTLAMAPLLRRRGFFLRTVDFCQYGVPWRKRTYFMFWGVPESSIELK
eukprot:12514534-Alexandrium_andersonii.AAC.1